MVDWGSDDNGPAIVEKFASLDPRIRLVQEKAKVCPKPRNQGICESSKSELIASLDADDEWISVILKQF